MQSINECPICEGRNFSYYLTCADHTVSHETFQLVKCQSCGFVITSPRPENSDLGNYYISNNYISHSRRIKNVFDLVYRITRHFTLQWKATLIKKYLYEFNRPEVLDYGCGTGEFLNKCETSGFAIQGVEPSDKARYHAELLLNKKIHPTIETLNQQFDIITLWHVLEHIPNLNDIIKHLNTHLKQNGTMFIAVPNHNSEDAKIYKEQWAGYDVPRHLWHFTSQTMNQLLNKHGLKVKEIIPMKLDAFYVSILSEKYIKGYTGPMQMMQGFSTGLKSNIRAKSNQQYSSLIYIIRK